MAFPKDERDELRRLHAAHQEEAWEAIPRLLDALDAAEAERDLMEKKVITCGVAATHPDPLLTATKTCYVETWNSPQADAVRSLRKERDALKEKLAAMDLLLNNAERVVRDGIADRDAAESLAWDALGRPEGTHDTTNVQRLCEAHGALKATLAKHAESERAWCELAKARGEKLAALVEATAEVHEKLRINADGKATVTVGKAIALRRELGEALAAAKVPPDLDQLTR